MAGRRLLTSRVCVAASLQGHHAPTGDESAKAGQMEFRLVLRHHVRHLRALALELPQSLVHMLPALPCAVQVRVHTPPLERYDTSTFRALFGLPRSQPCRAIWRAREAAVFA